jgi:flagellar hook-basal body complex protein FliE
MNISRIGEPSVNMLQTPGTSKPEVKAPTGGKSFTDTLKDSVAKVEQMQQTANQSVTDLAVGRTKTLHETMISVEQASISMNMLLAVRNKVVSAYQEIMRMQF